MKRKNQTRYILPAVVLLLLCVAFTRQTKPTLFFVGDSTVKNGTGRGSDGLWGWGAFMAPLLDTNKISVQNRALGGTSSGSFWSGGYWARVEKDIKPGDIVLIQFGHNDGRATTLRGISDDSMEVVTNPTTQAKVMAHSFGWNIRRYIKATRAKGGIPVVVSLVPRNRWKDGKVDRVASEYVEWDKAVAEQEKVDFIDLNKIVADHYDKLGEQKVRAEFYTEKDAVHTIEAGAKFNAACVIEGLRGLKSNPVKQYILK